MVSFWFENACCLKVFEEIWVESQIEKSDRKKRNS
jgi:hypothetical protein